MNPAPKENRPYIPGRTFQRDPLISGSVISGRSHRGPETGQRRRLAYNELTFAIPAFVTVIDLVEPSIGGTSAPLDETSNFCTTACGKTRWLSPVFTTM
jgi:hypothetical protein